MKFRDVSIYPSHYRRSAIVAWIVEPSLKDAEFYIYRKWDGGSEWELLNTAPVYGTTYADVGFVIPNKEQTPAYRVVAIQGTKEYESPEVAVFSKSDRKAFGVAQNIIRALYHQARQDGIPVLYYPLIKNGKMSSALDDVTGQRTKAPCPDATNPDYGTYYEGGYYRPFLTYVRPMEAKLTRQTRMDDGLFDETIQNTTFLAFPPVRTNDMVVDVTTDRRWFIGEGVQVDLVRSVIPVSYRAPMSLQSHSHPCYAVPIPDNYHELVSQLSCQPY